MFVVVLTDVLFEVDDGQVKIGVERLPVFVVVLTDVMFEVDGQLKVGLARLHVCLLLS